MCALENVYVKMKIVGVQGRVVKLNFLFFKKS